MASVQVRMTENVLKKRHYPGTWIQREMDADLRLRLEKVYAQNQRQHGLVVRRHEEAPLLRKLYEAGVTVVGARLELGRAGSGSA